MPDAAPVDCHLPESGMIIQDDSISAKLTVRSCIIMVETILVRTK